MCICLDSYYACTLLHSFNLGVIPVDWCVAQISSWTIPWLTTSVETTFWWACCWGRLGGLFKSSERSVTLPSRCWRDWWSNTHLTTATLQKWVPQFDNFNCTILIKRWIRCTYVCASRVNRPGLPPSTSLCLVCSRRMSTDLMSRNQLPSTTTM